MYKNDADPDKMQIIIDHLKQIELNNNVGIKFIIYFASYAICRSKYFGL